MLQQQGLASGISAAIHGTASQPAAPRDGPSRTSAAMLAVTSQAAVLSITRWGWSVHHGGHWPVPMLKAQSKEGAAAHLL